MEKAKQIRALYGQGLGGYKLAKMFRVNYRTIYDILWNRTWKEESGHLENY
jgi:transposase